MECLWSAFSCSTPVHPDTRKGGGTQRSAKSGCLSAQAATLWPIGDIDRGHAGATMYHELVKGIEGWTAKQDIESSELISRSFCGGKRSDLRRNAQAFTVVLIMCCIFIIPCHCTQHPLFALWAHTNGQISPLAQHLPYFPSSRHTNQAWPSASPLALLAS